MQANPSQEYEWVTDRVGIWLLQLGILLLLLLLNIKNDQMHGGGKAKDFYLISKGYNLYKYL